MLNLSLNFNPAACCLRLNVNEGDKFYCELAMKFYTCNVNARCGRTITLLNVRLVENVRVGLEIPLKFEPNNKHVLKELGKLEGGREREREREAHAG